jgi:transketolase
MASAIPMTEKLSLYADMCRANALMAVKKAGSGHLGSSFSAMDIVAHLYLRVMNTLTVGISSPDRDIYFSSKGHDVPGFYAALYSFGLLPEEKLLMLRRLGGLDGHPDTKIPGVEANSGSLGMGISKGRGMAWAKRYRGHGGRVFVLIGDGELQEGQNYEALHSCVQQNVTNLTVIVDHNKLQSDRPVDEIVSLQNLENTFAAFGWHVARCDGHDHGQLARVFADFTKTTNRPQILIADTIKGRGISFMEHPRALKDGGGFYRWHSGAPPDAEYLAGYEEMTARISTAFGRHGLGALALKPISTAAKAKPEYSLVGEPVSPAGPVAPPPRVSDEYVAVAYGEELVKLAATRKDIVVLDADLSADCKTRTFETTYPERFIENGIAEQDMVSMAGGLARCGLLPVVNSFASFLASRSNEQIYNNASENTKIIYVCHYAGMIPAGPGKSHQSIRDISLFGALPNCVILQPCNAAETRMVLDYAVSVARENVMIRLIIGPSPRLIPFPANYTLLPGVGVALTGGGDAVLFAYGPVMVHEALLAAERLLKDGFHLSVVNMPWLNRFDTAWLSDVVKPFRQLFVLDDHAPTGGLGDGLLNALNTTGLLAGRTLCKMAVEGYPVCGTPTEALKQHQLDGDSLATRILRATRTK